MPLMFCNVSWMREYKGHHRLDGKIDAPQRGGSYVNEHGIAHECCNFLADKDGIVYGHVETIRGEKDTKIDISKNLDAPKNAELVEGIDVVWIATHENGGRRVIGWYKNATIYRERQYYKKFPTKQHKRDSIESYRIVAEQKNVYLIPENERSLRLNPQNEKKGWPGEHFIFYPENYSNNIELAKLVSNLNNMIHKDEKEGDNLLSLLEESWYVDEKWFVEGNAKLVQHIKKERSRELVKQFKENLEDYSCSICGFSFEETYGQLGNGFIEAHHVKPISTLTKETKMLLDDLIAVCPNCHRMLHKSNPPLSGEKLKAIIDNNK